ncbi:MAG: CvpA family protein [Suipraeoptans sp.]
MNWLLILVGAVFIISIAVGIYRGAIKILVSLVTTIVVIILVSVLTPYVATGLKNATPVDDMIEEYVVDKMTTYTSGVLNAENGTGLTEDAVRKVLNAAGITEEMLEGYGFTVEDITEGKVSSEDLEGMGVSSQILAGLKESQSSLAEEIEEAEIPRDVQVQAINNAELPEVFKNLLMENNNDEGYAKVGAETFGQYVAGFLSNIIMHVIAFISLFLIITIIVRAIIFALNTVTELPVVGVLNRIGGAVLGAAGALIIVWFLFLVITLVYAAGIGQGVYEMIQDNSTLAMIYNYNPIMTIALRF